MASNHISSPRVNHPLIIAMVSLFALGGLSYLFVMRWPHYIKLDVDLPGEKDWHYTEKTTRTWHDTGLNYFIYRQETRVYTGSSDNFTSWESVIDVFDQHFSKIGWKRLEEYWYYFPCHYMPETAFLKEGESGFIVYKPEDWDEFDEEYPTICLAVWPIENYDGFNVVIMSINPSPQAIFFDILD